MMPDREKVIKGLESCEPSVFKRDCSCCPYKDEMNCDYVLWNDVLTLLKEQETRIKKYEYVFDFLGIGLKEWATKIIDGEAEAICEVDEHRLETVIRFKHI